MKNNNKDQDTTVWIINSSKNTRPRVMGDIEKIQAVAKTKKSFCIAGPGGELKVIQFGEAIYENGNNEFSFYRNQEEAKQALIENQKAGIVAWLANVETLLNNATQLPCMAMKLDELTQGSKLSDYRKVMEQLTCFFKNWEFLDRLKYLAG